MNTYEFSFDEAETLQRISHFLPKQAPLKDFIHHNSLHAFDEHPFETALVHAKKIFGYRTTLSLSEYQDLYAKGRINKDVFRKVLVEEVGAESAAEWHAKMFQKEKSTRQSKRIGALRRLWKTRRHLDLDAAVHDQLFRVLCSYLDQGISIWPFPENGEGLLSSIKELECNGITSFFHHPRAKFLLNERGVDLEYLLNILVGDPALYENYLFDQQFAHAGWSGLIDVLEHKSDALFDKREVSLRDVIFFELLLEIDACDRAFDKNWLPLIHSASDVDFKLLQDIEIDNSDLCMQYWQKAYEWTYYNEVLVGLSMESSQINENYVKPVSFQALFCIDDRECSIRRHVEHYAPCCQTYGTPGHFGVPFYYQPQGSSFKTKACPAPFDPTHLILERAAKKKNLQKEHHFSKHSHSFIGGWLLSQTLGFWSAVKLFLNIFKPSLSPATATSFAHMDKFSELSILHHGKKRNGLQIGFTTEEMMDCVENVLRSIGLTSKFADLVYVIGHGSSSINNPYYAGYDCGACSGRPGSVNARVFSDMANRGVVRSELRNRGIEIPESSQFVGGLHDTSRDEIIFYDEQNLKEDLVMQHQANQHIFKQALHYNAKERSRRFISVDTNLPAKKVHEKVKVRSISLFEPRPELNHATNALCIIGNRTLTRNVFLDRRAFLNSYDYQQDPDGKHLLNILNAAAPVCGGINLEYYFSRVDNQKLGAGSKLPHNVMGLIGLANGIGGDLRPGLPSQMIEMHDPIRLMMIVQHKQELVLKAIQQNPSTFNWFKNRWIWLCVLDPITHEKHVFDGTKMKAYDTVPCPIGHIAGLKPFIEESEENLPVMLLESSQLKSQWS
ncbi:MAG: hypothetical protein ACI8ZN_001884 [Bacteroidia bacterium]|jgi:uncharacterized protein YbcC (UPF0753/DUF2309 family)